MSSSPQSNEPEEAQMNTVPYDTAEEGWDRYEEQGEDYSPPGRPRRQFFNRATAALLALVLGAVGFYVGVRVEKSQMSNSSSTSGAGAAGRLAALTGSGGATGARTGARAAGAAGATGAAGRAGAGGFAGAAGGGGGGLRALFGGGGSSTFGTVSSIDGNKMYITEASGNTVEVTLSSATKVTKNVTVGKSAVRPGDAVVVAGAKGSGGSISATTLSDTGASPAASAGGSGGSGGNNSTSGSSAVSSLFGGG